MSKYKDVEEFEVADSRTERKKGKATVYLYRINKVRLGTKLDDFLKKPKKHGKVRVFSSKAKTILATAIPLILVGTIVISSHSDFKMTDKDKTYDVDRNINQEELIGKNTTNTIKVKYTVEYGDSLWSIAAKYCSDNYTIAQEINKICKDNHIDQKAILREGKELTLNVPEDKAFIFGDEYKVKSNNPYGSEYVEDSMVLDWESYEYFIYQTWENTPHAPENLLFDVQKKEIMEEGLIKIAEEKYKLEEMINNKLLDIAAMELKYENTGVDAKSEAIKEYEAEVAKKVSKINSMYLDAVSKTEDETGKVYGEDFVYQTEHNQSKKIM